MGDAPTARRVADEGAGDPPPGSGPASRQGVASMRAFGLEKRAILKGWEPPVPRANS